MSDITEIVAQPRTGSQCPQTGVNKNASWLSGYSDNMCQGSTGNDNKQFSWNYIGSGAAVTLGFVNEVSSVGSGAVDACKAVPPFSNADGPKPWVFGNLAGGSNNDSRSFCIQPVEQLCYIDGQWDGMNYNPEEWNTTSLKDTFVSADFAGGSSNVGCVNSNNKTPYGGESPMMAQMCPVVCTYDAAKFTNLDQVLQYEKMYSKYETDADACFSGDKTQLTQSGVKSCLANTGGGKGKVTGNPIPNNPNSKPFRANYEAIMQRFCANKMDDSAKCPIDPQTGKPMPYCSYLMSTGAEGTKCRAWLNSYGAHKWTHMDAIGSFYCSNNPASPDCRCYSRLDTRNPDSAKFKQINSQIQQAAGGNEIKASCFYLPCADPTHYILSNDVFGMPASDMTNLGPDYGFNCGTTVCTNIIKSGADTNMSGDSAYIQCAPNNPDDNHNDTHDGDKHKNSDGGSVITNLSNGLPITDNVNVNRALTAVIFIILFIILAFLLPFIYKNLIARGGGGSNQSSPSAAAALPRAYAPTTTFADDYDNDDLETPSSAADTPYTSTTYDYDE